MFKLLLVLCVVAFSTAKVLKDSGTKARNVPKDTLWVLHMNDGDFNCKQLKSANKQDRREFEEVVEPSIAFYKLQQQSNQSEETSSEETGQKRSSKASPRTLGDSSEHSSEETEDVSNDRVEITKYDVKKGIKRMINKFILSHQGEPNFNVHPGDHDKVSLKLYFKGPFSALVVRYKNKRWNYFLKPPSPLPRWFYKKHTKYVTRSGAAMYVNIPDSIRDDFYGKFFYMLQSFFSFLI